jgi:hypothetical protein
MDKQTQSRAPLIVAILLLLPVLYVGSYAVAVLPKGHLVISHVTTNGAFATREHYRWGMHRFKLAYWPLEQIDRKIRPGAWEPVWESAPPLGISS